VLDANALAMVEAAASIRNRAVHSVEREPALEEAQFVMSVLKILQGL